MVGSKAFFGGYKDFHSKDVDYLEIVDSGDFEWRSEFSMRGMCTFKYKKEPIEDLVRKTIETGDALLIGKFLLPEVSKVLGYEVKDILPLESLLPFLDEKHKYIESIFMAVKENNSFELSQEQLDAAYEIYKKARENYRRREKEIKTTRLKH